MGVPIFFKRNGVWRQGICKWDMGTKRKRFLWDKDEGLKVGMRVWQPMFVSMCVCLNFLFCGSVVGGGHGKQSSNGGCEESVGWKEEGSYGDDR